MKPRSVIALIAALVMLAPFPAASEDQMLHVRAGHSIVIPAPDLVRVAVGSSKIAGVVPIGNTQVIVNAKTPGRTSVLIWTKTTFRSYDLDVSEEAVDALANMLRSAISDTRITVTAFESSVVIKGTVADDQQFAALADTISKFNTTAAKNNYTLVNAVTVVHPLGMLESSVASLPGVAGAQVIRDDRGNIIVSGDVANRTAAESALEYVRAQAGPYLAPDGKIIDRLAVRSNSQVDIKVYVLEVDETGLSQLGVRLQSATVSSVDPNTGITNYSLGDPSFTGIESGQQNFSGKPNSGPGILGRVLNIGAFFRLSFLAPTLDLILQGGHAKVLSSPDLVTMPGKEATFLVGGQIPVPVSTTFGEVSVEWKDYGVMLHMTPKILGNGAVETVIAPEVSDLDYQDAVSLNGYVIPAIKTSKLSTDIVSHPGESIVMGGMLRRLETRYIYKIPLLSAIPIIGQLFQSKRYQSASTDIVFVLTPEIIER